MVELPFGYAVSVALCGAALIVGLARYRRPWALPYCAVLGTIAAWYLLEPFYFPEEFAELPPRYVEAAYDCVAGFLLVFALATPPLCRLAAARPTKRLSGRSFSAERVLQAVALLWLLLLAYGVVRMEGDLVGALFPLDARAGSSMWARAAAGDAGGGGFIVASAGYLYVLCIASFGLLAFLVRRPGYRALAIALILISWPYAFLQGSRNVALAVVVPGVLSYLMFSRQKLLTKGAVAVAALLAVNEAMKMMIRYRDVGFTGEPLSEAEETAHLGLNMASELVYVTEFVDRGMVPVKHGMGYLAELANAVPRAIWPGKPLLGIDYAEARGFSGGEADIGVFATISTGVIGQGVINFGPLFGPVAAALLMSAWVAILTRFRTQGTPLRVGLFLIGLGLTFNLGRDITLLVLWPMVFGYLGVRFLEAHDRRAARRGPVRRLVRPRPLAVRDGSRTKAQDLASDPRP